MPVPLNAFTEVIRTWLTKRLGYLVDDTIPVRWEGVKAPTPSDIDIICAHPSKNEVILNPKLFKLPSGEPITLKKYLAIESKGWFDIGPTSAINALNRDICVIMKDRETIPKSATKKKDKFQFSVLKEETLEKLSKRLGSKNIDRVIIIPSVKRVQTCKPRRSKQNLLNDKVIPSAQKKGITILEMGDIITDILTWMRGEEAKDDLRRNFILELLHLLDKYKFIKQPS